MFNSVIQAVAGLAADGRQIVARAKSEATNYQRFLSLFITLLSLSSISSALNLPVMCPSNYKFHLLVFVKCLWWTHSCQRTCWTRCKLCAFMHPLLVAQALRLWDNSRRLWQRWSPIIYGWTIWHLLCRPQLEFLLFLSVSLLCYLCTIFSLVNNVVLVYCFAC